MDDLSAAEPPNGYLSPVVRPPVLEALPAAGASAAGRRLGSVPAYAAATVITVAAILSQYVLPDAVPALRGVYGSFFGDLFIVYGIPILAFALLVGGRPLAGFADNTGRAVVQGVAWYGALSVLAFVVVLALTIVYVIVDPSALNALSKTTPVIQSAEADPWFWVVFSFVIGLVEEVIFRGWIFGYWLVKDPNRWALHATWTSGVFAGVHLYYGQTYGLAAPLVFPSLFLLGFAFAAAMRASGGNVLVVAILHGVNDAVAFYSLVSANGALALHYGLILVGALVGLILYIRSRPASTPPTPWGGQPPVAYRPTNPYALLPPPEWIPAPPPPTAPPPAPPPPP
ncbi:MAG TPA: type II CAAX endopeptidase family protein [Thermoplasmata archaeon]|nr:type II CAAX endopeptidase family protein [Thermoplasmata archaeon]